MLIILIALIIILYIATKPRKRNGERSGTPSKSDVIGQHFEEARLGQTTKTKEQEKLQESPYKWWMIIAILGGSLILSLLRSIDADIYKGVPAYIGAWIGELAAPVVLVTIITLIRYFLVKREGILKFIIIALLVTVVLTNILLEYSRANMM